MIRHFLLRPVALAWLSASLAACAMAPREHARLAVIDEAWISGSSLPDVVDSVAAWPQADGGLQVIATAKGAHRLRFYDAADGRLLRMVGSAGAAPGQFDRPNGIFVADDLAFVVERDGRRVQVLDLRDDRVLGQFGEDVLHAPYGLWVWPQGEGRYQVFVTDSYSDEAALAERLHERVKRFALDVGRRDRFATQLLATFGDTEGEGVLHTVESIWGDPLHGRLLIADEHADHRDLKVYDFDGHYLGRRVGRGQFHAEPEGIALIDCGGGDGYWLVSDQHARHQSFQLFDRRSLASVGAFAPRTTRMVDGIWFQPGAHGAFRDGVLFSQHDDRAVVAFDWARIVAALDLRAGCQG